MPTVAFDFHGKTVRTAVIDGETWFVHNDVCASLEIANPRDAITRLEDDERGVALADTPGGRQEMIVVNESGLYALIMTSNKAAASSLSDLTDGSMGG